MSRHETYLVETKPSSFDFHYRVLFFRFSPFSPKLLVEDGAVGGLYLHRFMPDWTCSSIDR